jgi:hypothetical protein
VPVAGTGVEIDNGSPFGVNVGHQPPMVEPSSNKRDGTTSCDSDIGVEKGTGPKGIGVAVPVSWLK